MKIKTFLAIALSLTIIAACDQTNKNSNEAQLPSKSLTDSTSYLIGVNFGSFLKNYDFGEDLNYSQIIKGMKDFIKAKGNDRNDSTFMAQFRINPNLMNEVFNSFLGKRMEYKTKMNKESEEKFLKENKIKEGVKETASGIQYIIRQEGSSVKATNVLDTVTVKYTGFLPDNTKFDSSEGEEVTFPLNQVIKGWGEGMQLIGEGGTIQLVIPSSLAYGERGTRGIEPCTPLTFEVELVKVSPYVEKVEKKANSKK